MLPNTSVLEFRSLKQTRRYGAKRRTGCVTCKTRHVKCDEGQPVCSRCTNGGFVCGGYVQKAKISQFEQSQNGIQRQEFVLLPVPKVSAFGGDTYYLEFYYHCVCPLFSLGRFDDSFWRRTALQMAQTESTVQYALAALGRLFSLESGSLKHARSGLANSDRTFLSCYNKAVRCLVDRIDDASYNPQVGVVVTILFVCIEFLRGNHYTAFTHLKGGLKIISEWRKSRARSNELHGTLLSPTTSAYVSKSADIPIMMEENVTQLFARTIATAVLFNIPIEEFLSRSRPSFHYDHFSSIRDAQSFGNEFNSRAVLFITMMAGKIMAQERITAKDMENQAQLLESCHAWFRALRLLELNLPESDRIAVSSLKVGYYAIYIGVACILDVPQKAYDTHLSSFKDLVKHAKIVLAHIGLHLQETNSVQSPRAPAMIHSSSSSPASARNTSANTPSPLPPSSGPTPPAAHFTFEISLIPSLYLTALRCRCPATRREAISLLALNPPREGLWDAEQHAIVARRIIEIEECEVDESGWPAESSRLWCAMIDPNMDQAGGFSVVFALAKWVQEGGQFTKWGEGLQKLGAQWEERFVL